jgi:hypothetical protein
VTKIFLWEFVLAEVMNALVEWLYDQVVGLLGDLFSWMGNMGYDLFMLNPVRAVVLFFSYLGWTLYLVGLAMSTFETAIEYQNGRGNLKDIGINAIKGFMATALFTTFPVELYKLAITVQGELTSGISGLGGIIDLANNALTLIVTLTTKPLLLLIGIIMMGYAIVKVFFGNLKRGGILLIQIAVGSLYMFSVPRGYIDGFVQWVKQVIGLCLTAFLQSVFLTIGLLILPSHPVLGIGIMLSAGEVPRIAGAFGLETSTRANITSAVYAVQSAVNTTRTIMKAVAK